MTREQQDEIRRLRAMGEGYKKIGALLNLSVNTVKSFCRREADREHDRSAEQEAATSLSTVTNEESDMGNRQEEHGSVERIASDASLCLRCQKPITSQGKRRTRKFCSDSCKVAYWRTQAKPNGEWRRCAGCGRLLFGHDSHRKYCSHGCYISHRFGRTNGGQNGRSA